MLNTKLGFGLRYCIVQPAGTPDASLAIELASKLGSVYSNVPDAEAPFSQLLQYDYDGIVLDFHSMWSIFVQPLNMPI